jgi:hypothetical protein
LIAHRIPGERDRRVHITDMKTDIETIHEECRKLGTLIQALEAAAVHARGATGVEPKRAAVGEVERTARAASAALERVSRLAERTDAARKGIPDPVVDLDQDPQD